jgi:hypothetical protein
MPPVLESPLYLVSTSSLMKLATKICQETEKISSYTKENGLPEPSFNADSAVGFQSLRMRCMQRGEK